MIRSSLLIITTLMAASYPSINCIAQDEPCGVPVPGQVYCDDFSDGSWGDGEPVRWQGVFGTGLDIVDESLAMYASGGAGGAVSNVRLQDMSMRTQTRLLVAEGAEGFVGVQGRNVPFAPVNGVNGYIGGLFADGRAAIAVNDGSDDGEIEEIQTDLRPLQEDVVIQLDVFDDTISLRAWRPGGPIPIDPLLELQDNTIAIGDAAVFAGAEHEDSPAALYRYVLVATEPIPIPEPSSAVLLGLAVACLVTCSRRKRSPMPTRGFRGYNPIAVGGNPTTSNRRHR